MPQFFFTAHTFKCDTKKFYVEEKLILDLGKQPHERKYIKAFLCFIKLTQHEQKNMTTERKKFHRYSTRWRSLAREQICQIICSECMRFSWYLFYCIYVVFAVWRYVCAFYASFLLILFIKTRMMKADNYTDGKKFGIMNLWRAKNE